MPKRFLLRLILISLVICYGCKNEPLTKLIIYTKAPINSSLFIRQVPYFDEKLKVIDSAVIKDNHDSLIFYLPRKEERLYEIVLKERRFKIDLINDSKLIRIHIDYFLDSVAVKGSPATISLQTFGAGQLKLAGVTQALVKKIDSLQKIRLNNEQAKNLNDSLEKKLTVFYNRYVQYADTVKSPAGFIKVYNNIDFDKDYKGLKKFITANAARFPHNPTIQQIKKKALEVVKIYEEEYNVGDKLPFIKLPDLNDLNVSTSSLNGKYYLIDFWSVWCPNCMAFKAAQKKIISNGFNKVTFVSVAIDDQKANWKRMIQTNQFNWTQLIDEQMWDGPTVKTLLFDSIPMNFLISPRGQILKKAIEPDSLSKILFALK